MKIFNLSIISVILTVFIAVLFPTTSEAIPAFARKSNMACSTCHTAWPALNAFGRQYKEHGYRLGHLEVPSKTISKDLSWEESLPISVMLVARPYDKKKSGKSKNRAIHEVELMVAGPMGKKMSGFFEVEAEDEDKNARGFETGVSTAALTYNMHEYAHLQFSWGGIAWFDPYNSYSNHLRLTRGSNAVIDRPFGGADNDGKLKDSRQNTTLYGRPLPKFFYGLSLSGDAGDSEGVEGDTVTLRVAFDVAPYLTIGALGINGTCTANAGNCLVERKYKRTAFDIQSEFSGFTLNAATVEAEDDNAAATASVKRDACYIQAFYTFMKGARATWVPLIRLDKYDNSAGLKDVKEYTISVNYYFTENIRGMLELVDKNGGISSQDDERVTLQLYASF